MSRARAVGAVAVVAGLVFGAAGGEYGTLNWWQLRREVASERAALDSLALDIDSLTEDVQALERDPAAQERAARELFGMLRPREILFRFEDPEP